MLKLYSHEREREDERMKATAQLTANAILRAFAPVLGYEILEDERADDDEAVERQGTKLTPKQAAQKAAQNFDCGQHIFVDMLCTGCGWDLSNGSPPPGFVFGAGLELIDKRGESGAGG